VSITWADDGLGVTSDPDRFEEAIAAFRRRVPMTDAEWDALEAEERLFAFKVANVAQADLVQDVFDALERAIETGTTADEFEAEIGAQLAEAWGGEDPVAVEMIFRTNVMSAYTSGAHEILSSPEAKEARPYWAYALIDDDRLCPICGEFEGVVLPADDPFWLTHIPPLHIGCRCPHPAPLSEDEAREAGVTKVAPTATAADGFGTPVETWEPDATRFADEVGAELERKLAR
jgi:SPP1 gp7 family putative phage head morphogenesis protein